MDTTPENLKLAGQRLIDIELRVSTFKGVKMRSVLKSRTTLVRKQSPEVG
jgi:hypothetical protein